MSEIIGPRRRGPYPRAFKAQIIGQCRQSGASVAEVAARHGLREALVYRWLAQDTVEAGSGRLAADASGRADFIPFEPVSPGAGASIRIELQHTDLPRSRSIGRFRRQAAVGCGSHTGCRHDPGQPDLAGHRGARSSQATTAPVDKSFTPSDIYF